MKKKNHIYTLLNIILILLVIFILYYNILPSIREENIGYVINLDKRPDRWIQINKLFSNIPFVLERFSAINHTEGMKGCGLSHSALIQMAKNNNLPSSLIMEDDCEPSENFIIQWPLIKKWLDSHKNEWDIFIGGNSYYFKADTNSLSTVKPICTFNGEIKLYYTKIMALHFYYLNNSGYDIMLKWKEKMKEPIDMWPNETNMKIVSCTPFIAKQYSDYSNIGNHDTAYYKGVFEDSESKIASINNIKSCYKLFKSET